VLLLLLLLLLWRWRSWHVWSGSCRTSSRGHAAMIVIAVLTAAGRAGAVQDSGAFTSGAKTRPSWCGGIPRLCSLMILLLFSMMVLLLLLLLQ
jgi:hypothetical protein